MKTCSLNIAKQIEKFANTVSHWVIIFKCSEPVNNMGVRVLIPTLTIGKPHKIFYSPKI